MSLSPNEVKTENIASGAVTTPKIADEQVTSAKIKNSAVTSEKLATEAITGSKIADNAVTGSKIRDNTVRTEKIASGAVTTAKIGAAQVTGSRLQDKAVTTEKIANSSITTEKIANGAVTPAKLSFTPPSIVRPITPPVSTDEIANGAVTPEKLSFVPGGALRPLVPPVATDEIADASIIAQKIATSAVTKIKMASNSVGYLEIINGSVEPRHIRAIDTPANGEVPSYNQAQERFEWIAPGGGGVTRPLTPPIATGEIADVAVTKPKLSYKVISITIPAQQVGGLFPPLGDPDLNGGVILGYSIPTNQDQLIRQLFLLPGLPQGTGISILLNQPAIADNTFDVVVLRQ